MTSQWKEARTKDPHLLHNIGQKASSPIASIRSQVTFSPGSDWDVFLSFPMCLGIIVLIQGIIIFAWLVPYKDRVLLLGLLLTAVNSLAACKNNNKNPLQTSQAPHTRVFSTFRRCPPPTFLSSVTRAIKQPSDALGSGPLWPGQQNAF